ncbi:MAG: bifunctional folylpolyglutamate synthase/dihydrofolate synthase [Deltaproteobacteria bacterium]|nr:bifunctional folylpolyglutamate synthase/dihydrofolate synthase [Deltaproteobacteria bacterium]
MGKPFEPLSPDPAYDQALSYLYGLQKFGIKFGLSNTENLLRAFGHPQKRLRLIHIAGTNGKGSVAAMLASIFSRAGYRTGLYTSPHLVDFRERFQINGRLIPRDLTLDLIAEVRSRTDPGEPPTFFEFVTAMALLYFDREGVDIGIIETGLGGRLDATNIIRPRITVITPLGLEHQEYLGRTLTRIAEEKAGIIKAGIPLVSGVTQSTAREVLGRTCLEKGAPFYLAGRDFGTRKTGVGTFTYVGFGKKMKELQAGLLGDHQIKNAGLALSAALLWQEGPKELKEGDLREGLRTVFWPGRLELVPQKPRIVLDGAHNPLAMKALARSLTQLFEYKKLFLVIGIMQDKDIPGIFAPIVPLADQIFLTRAEYNRSAAPEHLFSLLQENQRKCRVFPNIARALDQAREEAAEEDLICVTGSLFVVGEARNFIFKDEHPTSNIQRPTANLKK